MKSRTLTWFITMILFVTLALPLRLAAQGQRQQQPRYAITDLGTLGGAFSNAFGISNKGSVVGWGELAGDADPVHAFLWRKGRMTDLGNFGGRVSQANRVNEADAVAGSAETPAPDPLGEDLCDTGDFLICLPFIWQHGVMTPLPTLGGNNGAALDINSRGQIVGFAETATPDRSCPAAQILRVKPVLWEKGKVQELPTIPGFPIGAAIAINDKGEVVGVSGDCDFVFVHILLWHNGTVTELDLPGTSPAPGDINNRGQVVGIAGLPGGGAFLWQNGVITDLGALPGDVISIASGINNQGQVAGQSCDINDNCSMFLWENGVITDLNTLIPADSPLFLLDGGSINSRGEIVGVAVEKSTGDFRAFLAIPTNGEGTSESATAAAPGETRQRPKFVLPEKIRRLLSRRLLFGRFLGTSQKVALSGAAAILGPTATLSPTSLTFSTQAIGTTSAAKTVTLKNNGTTFLTISSIAVTGTNAGNFAQTHTCGSSLAAGASCRINVVFKPTASGTRTAALSISDNAAGSPQKVTLSGIGTTAKLSPVSVTFSTQAIGTTSGARKVTLTNVGATSLTITSIAITGTNAGDFGQTHTCGTSLAAGANCSIGVTFKPTASGTRTAVLSISDNAAGSPQKLTLSGIGTTVMLSPTSLNFGVVAVVAIGGTTSAAQTVTLTNVGTTALSINGIAITGTNAGDFAQTHTCGSSLAAGASCTISVTFRPTAIGTRRAAVSITDNAAGSPQNVALSGIGGATGGGSGFCLVTSGNALTGYCVGVHNGICRSAYDTFHCPPGQQAELPGLYLSCPHSTFKVDGSRSCAP
jgi:probable HAF family extracellular repeat protein